MATTDWSAADRNWTSSEPSTAQNVTSTVTESFLELLEEEEEEELLDPAAIRQVFYLYIAPVLIVMGVVGNCLSVVVLQSKHFRKAPSSFILSMLALADIGVLLTGLLRHWIRALTDNKLDVRYVSLPACRAQYLFTYMFPQLSSWTLILLTVERLLSVTKPLTARQICSRRNMVVAWAVIVLALFALNSHAFKTLAIFVVPPIGNVCFYNYLDREVYHFAMVIWPWIDITLVNIMPFVIISSCNVVIVTQVVRAARMRQSQMQAKGGDTKLQSVTFMLVAISVFFILSTTPLGIYLIGVPYWPQASSREKYGRTIAWTVCNVLFYVNSSVNFLLYCVSGSRFRRSLVAVICCREMVGKKPDTSSSKYATSVTMATTAMASKSVAAVPASPTPSGATPRGSQEADSHM